MFLLLTLACSSPSKTDSVSGTTDSAPPATESTPTESTPTESAPTESQPTDSDDTEPVEEPEWGYDGEIGPEYWGSLYEPWALCDEGTQQSPIDIIPDAAVPIDAPVPAFGWTSTNVSAYNPGHYLRYEVDAGSTLSWNDQTWNLKQFHFHGKSEHTIAGEHFDLEIHFVHELSTDTSKLAVVAVIGRADPDMGKTGILDEAGPLKFRDLLVLPESETASSLGGTANLGEVFSFLTGPGPGYGHYTGSLTTPDCGEGVEFLVYGDIVGFPPADVDALHAVYDHNNRPTQPLNGRVISVLANTPPG